MSQIASQFALTLATSSWLGVELGSLGGQVASPLWVVMEEKKS
jgi:hypothetical protein